MFVFTLAICVSIGLGMKRFMRLRRLAVKVVVFTRRAAVEISAREARRVGIWRAWLGVFRVG